MSTAVIEYQFKAYSPPDDSQAWDVQAAITHAAGVVIGTTRGLLADLRTALEEAGLCQHGVQPTQKYYNGQWCPTWREVWRSDEQVMSNLSPEAEKARQRAAGIYDSIVANAQAGPWLEADDDGNPAVMLVVPSALYKPEAAAFWRKMGFRYNGTWKEWQRDTRRPLRGRRYSAQAWLEAARRKYFEFFPNLEKGNRKETNHDLRTTA